MHVECIVNTANPYPVIGDGCDSAIYHAAGSSELLAYRNTLGEFEECDVFLTYGLENSSKRYSYASIKKMIERQKEKYGWEFIFIGANMDVIQEANKFGIDQAVRYACDEEGTALNYSVLSENIVKMRTTVGNAKESLPNDWSHKIREDYQRRK